MPLFNSSNLQQRLRNDPSGNNRWLLVLQAQEKSTFCNLLALMLAVRETAILSKIRQPGVNDYPVPTAISGHSVVHTNVLLKGTYWSQRVNFAPKRTGVIRGQFRCVCTSASTVAVHFFRFWNVGRDHSAQGLNGAVIHATTHLGCKLEAVCNPSLITSVPECKLEAVCNSLLIPRAWKGLTI